MLIFIFYVYEKYIVIISKIICNRNMICSAVCRYVLYVRRVSLNRFDRIVALNTLLYDSNFWVIAKSNKY